MKKLDYKRPLTFGQRLTYGYFQFFDHFFGRERFFSWTRGHRRRFYARLEERLKASGPGTRYEVERRSDMTTEEFKKYMKAGIPVVWEGGAKHWDACDLWSLEYFKDLHGDDEIVMMDHTDIAMGYEETTLRDVIDNIRDGGSKYYRFYPLLKRHPEHFVDIDYDWLKSTRHKPCWGDAFHIFIGGKGGFTPLHNANTPNVFVQAHGEKEWVLIPNYYAMVVDPPPARNMYRSAPIIKGKDFRAFDLNYDEFPLYQYIDSYHVHLKEGDIFYNPPFMWHTVLNPTDSIGLGYRTFTPFHSFSMAPLYAFLELFATNPPIWKTYKIYDDINLLHLKETGLIKDLEAKRGERVSTSIKEKEEESVA